MKRILILSMFLAAAPLGAQEAAPTATPVRLVNPWSVSAVPWNQWFKKNAMVTSKAEYVHFFWNAQDFKKNFTGKDKKTRLGQAALQLVSRLYPSGAQADKVKVDIVYVLERDSYGDPKWDSLQQVAHLEFSRKKAEELLQKKAGAVPDKFFDRFSIY